ncbi:putative calreticulin [Monocercomonoides exilis]|uniref:putative calreticulin n=1 Tax=Monocercomonoides exilis TaxID=2049356 RepID=UPI003559727B|nr:putative calreticulin [Monocercomonoides exilis]|eukprot:MONOS_3179.1-p1 / transcript=MONOS_3179.1 / gene=MONOS_3179 / organism=Monocercomonoides_exilis_PA203 / gene_product=calreticulin / transcript_product=calreticulin / location=Mono_scaffold00072:136341-137757(-) / protein_length=409 / sequence_SO=supercontig / SO=protein_coding / is_pseudo=false
MLFAFIGFLVSVEAKVYFAEQFDYTWPQRWKYSTAHQEENKAGKFTWERPPKYYHLEASKGLKTSQDERYYHISADIGETVTNFRKNLFIGFTVTQTQDIKCSGSYLKFFNEPFDQENFNGDTPFELMFGPDTCGSINDQVHAIFRHEGREQKSRARIRSKDDKETHLYAIKLYANGSYVLQTDIKKENWGEFQDQWGNWYTPRFVEDPDAEKPEEWDDREEIPDPKDIKPADWDQPKYIPDPNATKMKDWNDTIDGEWRRPIIRNPLYHGEWIQKTIPNPMWMGPWQRPRVPNMQLTEEKERRQSIWFRYVAIDIWQVQSGTIFDNIFIGDDEAEFDAFFNATFKKQREVEEPGWEAEELRRQADRKVRDKKKRDEKLQKRYDLKLDDEEDIEVPKGDEDDEFYLNEF